jgi:hypothetical protein
MTGRRLWEAGGSRGFVTRCAIAFGTVALVFGVRLRCRVPAGVHLKALSELESITMTLDRHGPARSQKRQTSILTELTNGATPLARAVIARARIEE